MSKRQTSNAGVRRRSSTEHQARYGQYGERNPGERQGGLGRQQGKVGRESRYQPYWIVGQDVCEVRECRPVTRQLFRATRRTPQRMPQPRYSGSCRRATAGNPCWRRTAIHATNGNRKPPASAAKLRARFASCDGTSQGSASTAAATMPLLRVRSTHAAITPQPLQSSRRRGAASA